MNTTQEVLTVEAVTQYGFRAAGKNYNISPRLKESGITPQHFGVGTSYQMEVYTGPKGGKSVNSFGPVPVGQAPVGLPLPPALPPTTVTDTKAPGGVPPVAPAQKRAEAALPLANDKMSKEDWDRKSFLIHLDAILKSTLESPALAQLVVGKRLEEAQATKREWFKSSLKDYEDALNGTL